MCITNYITSFQEVNPSYHDLMNDLYNCHLDDDSGEFYIGPCTDATVDAPICLFGEIPIQWNSPDSYLAQQSFEESECFRSWLW